jgi:hypothetical protein
MVKWSNLLYSISTIALFAYCYYEHLNSPHASYDTTIFHGKRAIADVFKVLYNTINFSMIWACYFPVFLHRNEFAAIFNRPIILEDRFRTVCGSGGDQKRWKYLVALSSFIIVQLLIVGANLILGIRLTIVDTGVLPSIETLIIWTMNPFFETMVVLLFVICLAEVKKMFDLNLKVLNKRYCK